MNTHAHGTYFDGQVALGRAVTLEFSDSLVRVSGESLAFELELANVRVSDRLGEVPRFLYLPGDAVIETPDNAIVDAALAQRRRSRAARFIHLLESQQRIAAVACLLLVASIATLAFYGPPILARVIAQRVPDDVDRRIGGVARASIAPYLQPTTLSVVERERVRQQLIRLEVDPKVPRAKLEFYAMGNLPNAFALPGNVIIVTDALVRLPATDDEIAAVLAHELGHLQRRHGLQSVLRQSSALLIVAAVTGDLSAIASFAGTLPLTILTAGYARDLEREADRYALEMLRMHQIKPGVFSTVLLKLESAHGEAARNATYLSTHPTTEERTAVFGGLTAAERNAVLAEPWLQRAIEASQRRNHAAVIEHCTKYLETASHARAHFLRAQSHLALDNPAAFEADIKKALELDSQLLDAQLAHAEFLALRKRQFPQAIVAARTVLAREPGNVVALATLGYAETMTRDLEAAAKDLDRAVMLGSSDYRGWAYRGYLRMRREDFSGAIADYDRALALQPDTEWIRRNRGETRVRLRNYAGALVDLAAVTDTAQHDSDYFSLRGNAQHGVGKLDLAIADYTRAIDKARTGADLSEIYLNRGSAYYSSDKSEEAIADLTTALLGQRNHGEAYFLRALAYERTSEIALALADLEKALAAGKDEIAVLRQRGILYRRAGNLDAALRDLGQVLAREPSPAAFRSRGLIHFARSDYPRAEADFTKAINLTAAGAKGKMPEEYSEFFRLLVRRHQKKTEGGFEFSQAIAQWPDGWAKSVGQYLAGDITEVQLLATTNIGQTPTRQERLCEAHFYIGEMQLFAGDRAKAEMHFQKCLDTGVTHFGEYLVAQAEMERLRQGAGHR